MDLDCSGVADACDNYYPGCLVTRTQRHVHVSRVIRVLSLVHFIACVHAVDEIVKPWSLVSRLLSR